MKLSSAFLSATALLANVASGFLLEAHTNKPGLPVATIASLRGDTVGFYGVDPGQRVNISLAGPVILSGFGLQAQEEAGVYIFKSSRFGSAANVVSVPFIVVDGKFKWLGDEAAKWLLCGPPDALVLYLGRDGAVPKHMACIEADLWARESE